MQVAPQLSFKNFEPNARVRARIEKELAHLEKVHSRLTSCKVLIEGPAGQHRTGNLARVRLYLAVPGGQDIAVSNVRDDNHAHEDVMVAIRDAFRAAERQLKKTRPDPRVEAAMAPTRLSGRIARFLEGGMDGFIEGEDGLDYYFHAREATETAFADLIVGDRVTFRPEDGEKGPMARAVHRRQNVEN